MSKFYLMFAPLEDISDGTLRTLCYNYSCDRTFTEMTRIDALCRKNNSAEKRIEIKDNTPTEVQLLGYNEFRLEKFLEKFQPENGFVGFNLNVSCPSPQVISKGFGSAMIKRVSKVNRLTQIIQNFGYDVSIKLRLGLNQYEKDNKVYLNLINGVNAKYFIVHTRIGTDSYKVPADFTVYEELVKTGKQIVGNGDIRTIEQIDYLKKIGCYGAMIGRAAVTNPHIFSELRGNTPISEEKIKKDYELLSVKLQTEPKYIKNFNRLFNREIY